MKTIKTVCSMCSGDYCGIEVGVEDNRIVSIRGNKDTPLNEGRLCIQAQGARELLSDSNRLSVPLKRDGSSWQQISWDEALDTIAEKLSRNKEGYGAQSFALWEGQALEQIIRDGWYRRFLSLYGSPNSVQNDFMCFMPSVIAEHLTYGQDEVDGFESEHTRCVLLWGSNPVTSHNPYHWHAVEQAQRLGARLIVVDPRRTKAARKADIHAWIRPGSDAALALGLINVIIEKKLYDVDFVERWTTGFDLLAERVSPFTADKVETITGVPAEVVTRIAQTYASNRPAFLDVGNALEHHSNSWQILRALMILRSITGNLDIAGGHLLRPNLPLADITLRSHKPTGFKTLGADRYPLFVDIVDIVPGDVLIETMLSGKPYPIKAMIVEGANPLLTWPNSSRVGEAFRRLDFLVVMDLYMTPTARMADIVLPAASAYEKTHLVAHCGPFGADKPQWWLALSRPVMDPGERRSEWWFLCNLACRLGYGAYYPWDTVEEAIDHLLRPLGISFDELEANPSGLFYGEPLTYRRYEKQGFRTPTGKVELYSHVLESYGYDPLPHYEEPIESHARAPELATRYPLILNAGRRVEAYTHSRYKNLPSLRRRELEPVAEIHPATCQKYNVADGDWVLVETSRGSIELRARLTEDIVPGVIGLVHGWEEANANQLTDHLNPDPILGSPSLRSALCAIRRKSERSAPGAGD